MAPTDDDHPVTPLLKALFGVEVTLLGGILLNEFAVNTELLFVPLQPLGWVFVLSGFAIVLSVILAQDWTGGIIEE